MTVAVVLSGGMDSATLLYHVCARFVGLTKRPLCISFNYGQRHAKELVHAKALAGWCGCEWTVAELPVLHSRRSALTDTAIEVPHGHYEDESMKATVVPMRNPLMLTAAFAVAIDRGIYTVAYGAHAGDHAIYPDCRPAFIEAFRTMVQSAWDGMGPSPTLYAPFAGWTKAMIVREGEELGVPWGDTWSCYEGGDVHCGKCGTCVERREAFKVAGVVDPTVYA